MTHARFRHVAIWIDLRCTILLASEDEPAGGCTQHRVDAQECQIGQQYYDAVLTHLGPEDEILILGPGQAKRELCQRIEQDGGTRGRVVGLYDASRLADAEVVFPTGERWSSEGLPAAAIAPKGKLKAGFRTT